MTFWQQWLLSGITVTTIFELLRKVGWWAWKRHPLAKKMKEYDELLVEERDYVGMLDNWLTELQAESLDAIYVSLQNVGILVDEDKRITLQIMLSDRLFKIIDRITEEAYPRQIEHNRKVRPMKFLQSPEVIHKH